MDLLPDWSTKLIALYESGAANQFILYGNVEDCFVLPVRDQPGLGTLGDFLQSVLLGNFDVVLTYDLGNGIGVERGQEMFGQWPAYKMNPTLPREPRAAAETLTHYFRYVSNLSRLGGPRLQVACVVLAAELAAPQAAGFDPQIGAVALLLREWSRDTLLVEHDLATFLVAENLSDLHSLVAHNPRAATLKVGLPEATELAAAFVVMGPLFPGTLGPWAQKLDQLSAQLAGATLGSIETMLKTREHARLPLAEADLVALKKEMIERDSGGLIEFVESRRTLDDLYGQEPVKTWLRSDIALWRQNDLEAMPMGYLLCGPVGTGKTFMVECLAGEAGVPVVKLKNFRDRWIGSTEGNLEKIFRLLGALGRCYVFVDEADQALGKRDSGANDAGLSGRIYSMLAEEMSNGRNRGKVVWILASSRPDLIEVDLKRPGRIDVKIPLFPTTTGEESFRLMQALCQRREVVLPDDTFSELQSLLPLWLTPGAAEALAVKIYRATRVAQLTALEAARLCLTDYRSPIPFEVMNRQIQLAVAESSDLDFVPVALRGGKPAAPQETSGSMGAF